MFVQLKILKKLHNKKLVDGVIHNKRENYIIILQQNETPK